MSGNHARLAFSSADRWVECPGTIELSEGLPPEADTDETLEGNAADWVAKQYAAGNEVAYGSPTPVPGWRVDYDMIHGAKLWAANVGYGGVSGIPVVSSFIHPTDAWGEPDYYRWDGIEGILRVADYKYGFDLIEVFPNWQLLGYVCSVLEMLDLLTQPDVRVEMTIVQPRAWHKDGVVRTWKEADGSFPTVGDLRPFFNRMHSQAVRALPPPELGGELINRGAPPTKTGPHCLHCPARFHCKTLGVAASHIVEFVGRAERNAMDPAAIGTSLTILRAAEKILEARITGEAAQAEQLIRSGKLIPGWKMDSASSKLAWNKDVTVEEIDGLGAVIGRTMRKPPTVHAACVTPTQAINAGLDKAVIDQYATRGPGAMKLVPDDGTDARKAFGGTSC